MWDKMVFFISVDVFDDLLGRIVQQFGMGDQTAVILEDGVVSIGKEAFMYNFRLESIRIPDSVERIGEDAFYMCNKLTIHAPAGSYAEIYAKENNIPFVAE